MREQTPTVSERIQRAEQEIDALCHGKRWTMLIPVDVNNDSDVVMQLGFNAAKEEIERLSARCTELTDINAGLVKDHNYLLIDGAKWQTRAETAEARCTALEQERDQLAKAIAPTCNTIEDREHFTLDELVKTARNHRELTNDECEALKARYQHLEQAVRYVESYLEEQIHDAPAMTLDMYDHGAKMLLKRLREKAALASLLPAPEPTR